MKMKIRIPLFALLTLIVTGCETELETATLPCDYSNTFTSADTTALAKMSNEELVGYARTGGVGRCMIRYGFNSGLNVIVGLTYSNRDEKNYWTFINCEQSTEVKSRTAQEAAGVLRALIDSGKCW